MRDLLTKNLTYKLVAIFLAVVLWMNASNQETGFRQQVVEVPLEVRNLSSSLVASELPEKVKVRVEGEWSIVERITADQFSAFVRLDSHESGIYNAPVEVTVPAGVRLINISPASVSVRLTEMSSIQVPVYVEVDGGVAPGYTMLTPVVEPSEAIISGPEDILNKITSAQVKVSLNNITEDYVKVLPIRPQASGAGQSQVTVKPTTAKVSISVVQEDQTKTVNIEASVEGTPMEGYAVGAVEVEPRQVSISGAPELIANINSLKTLPVSVEGKDSSVTESVGLVIPEGVQVLSQRTINVSVEIVKQEE